MFSLNQEMLFVFYGKYKKKVYVPPENNMHQTKNFKSKEKNKIGITFPNSGPIHPPTFHLMYLEKSYHEKLKTLNSPNGYGFVFTKIFLSWWNLMNIRRWEPAPPFPLFTSFFRPLCIMLKVKTS